MKCIDESQRRRWRFSFRGSNWDIEILKEAIFALRFRSAALYTCQQDVLTRRPVDRKVTISIIMIAQRRDTQCNRAQPERFLPYKARLRWFNVFLHVVWISDWICDWNGHLIIMKNIMPILGHHSKKKPHWWLENKPVLSLVSDTCVRWFAFVTVLEKRVRDLRAPMQLLRYNLTYLHQDHTTSLLSMWNLSKMLFYYLHKY